MADRTGIEWTDATWTPIRARSRATGKVGWHCEHASPGCANCYSETFNERRLGTGLPFKPGHRDGVEHFLDEAMLLAPLRWRRPRRIFVCSMTDLFGDWVPDEWIDKMFAVMALCPQHTFQVLTKRSARMLAYLTQSRSVGKADIHNRLAWDTTVSVMNLWCPQWGQEGIDGPHRSRAIASFTTWPLPNVWLGVSTEDQRRADERIPDLLRTPAVVRFLSAEPLLGALCLKRWMPAGRRARRPDGAEFIAPHFFMTLCEHCDWLGSSELCGSDKFGDDSDVYCPCCHRSIQADEFEGRLSLVIAGGESGSGARPMHPDWVRSLRDQCAAAGVPFFFKQWGEWEINTTGHAMTGRPLPGSRSRYEGATFLDGLRMNRVGKKAAGRLLDGVEHNGMPEVRHG